MTSPLRSTYCASAVLALTLVACAEPTGGRDPGVGGPLGTDDIPRFVPRADGIDRRWLVVLATDDMPADDPRAVDSRVDELADEYVAGVEQRYATALQGFLADVDEDGARALSEDARVRFVEQDTYTRVAEIQSDATWGLDRIDQRASTLDGRYAYDATGKGVTAYVIDSGMAFGHKDFGGRARRGVDLVPGNKNGVDCNGHGTHVGGTIGGRTYGVAKDVGIVSVRVYDCNGDGELSRDIAAIEWIAKNAVRPAVANQSASGPASPSYAEAVAKLTEAGIPFVVAAGNQGADACDYGPAFVPDAITVGAVDRDDVLASFSNTGSCVDIHAPGVAITSAWLTSATAKKTIQGTSMATPHVTGAVARYLERYPSATVQEVAEAITSSATTGTTAAPIGTTDRVLFSGVEDAAPADPEGSEECPEAWRGDGLCDPCLGDDPDCEQTDDEMCAPEWYGDGPCDPCLGDDPDCGGETGSCPVEWYDDGTCDECLGDDPDCEDEEECPAEWYDDGTCDECLGDDPDCEEAECPPEWYEDGTCDECLGDDPDCDGDTDDEWCPAEWYDDGVCDLCLGDDPDCE